MTYLIIFVTSIISIVCFNNRALFGRLSLRPYLMFRRRQWDRIVTHGFVHADSTHLIVNMIVLWSFGMYVHNVFDHQYHNGLSVMGPNLRFVLLYIGGIAAAALYDVFRYRDDPYYSSIGASGAVSAVVFTTIFYNPSGQINLFFLLPIKGIIFALLYIGFETYSARRGKGKINHHAHIFGSIYGFIFPVLTNGVHELRYFINDIHFY